MHEVADDVSYSLSLTGCVPKLSWFWSSRCSDSCEQVHTQVSQEDSGKSLQNFTWLCLPGKWLINMFGAPLSLWITSQLSHAFSTHSILEIVIDVISSNLILFGPSHWSLPWNTDPTWLLSVLLPPSPLLSSWLFFPCCLLQNAVPWGSILHALFLSLHESFFTPIISLL